MIIYCKEKSETGFNLAKCLKDCEAKITLPENSDFIVNYGRLYSRANINANIITNKLEQLKVLKRNNVLVPEIYEFSNQRNIHSWDFSQYIFPILARKIHHTQGKDIIVLKDKNDIKRNIFRVRKRDFYTKYIPKKEEFRVHVLGDETAGISRKTKYSETINTEDDDYLDENHDYIPLIADKYVWSRNKGWIQQDYEGEYKEILKELAIKSCRTLNFDFGAVDIILGEDNKFYVLEINSAPRLNLRRRRLYAKYFRKKWKEIYRI